MGLNDLATTPTQDAVEYDKLPEQMGGGAPPPPKPGSYVWELSPLKDENFAAVQSEQYGARVRVKFDDNAPLVIRQSVGGEADGEPFTTGISNVPRKRGKGEDAPVASDWDYLNQALGETTRPTSARDYANKLIAKSNARAKFGADIEWSWSCNAERDAFFANDQGGFTAVPRQDGIPGNVQGCGSRFYQNSEFIQQAKNAAGGQFPLRITCSCGASVRAFGNLTRFRKVTV